MTLSVKIRSNQGCWTCRIRRKKCDERKPVCSVCAALEIDCHYSDKKPDWMDGADREKQTSDRIKQMIKLKANERRDRKWGLGLDAAGTSTGVPSSADPEAALSHSVEHHMILDSEVDSATIESSRSSSDTPVTSVDDESNRPTDDPSGWPSTEQSVCEPDLPNAAGSGSGLIWSDSQDSETPSLEVERELNSAMMFLDYVFPYLSPFYQPPLVEGGRGWMLIGLMRSKALYHTAISMATYFFSIVLADEVDGHEHCRHANWEEMQKQKELAIKAQSQNMRCLITHGVAGLFLKSIQIMGSIVQLLLFDAIISCADHGETWVVHLQASSSLFEQIIETHATDVSKPWSSVFERINATGIAFRFPGGRGPYTSEQAPFRFYTMNLLWADIIASTAFGTSPRLQRFWPELLEGSDPALPAQEFIGCQNWIMVTIGQIAALCAWKKEKRNSGALSVVELVRRASDIEARLRHGIQSLDLSAVDLSHDPSARAPEHPFPEIAYDKTRITGRNEPYPSQVFHTKLWAHAALTYLLVVVHGFQPALPEIQDSVAATMDLFRRMPSHLSLRTFSWPFMVTGCLSLPGQESFFRELVGKMGSMQDFGTVKEAICIIDKVSEHRSCVDADSWDIAACLNVLGRRSLLV